MNINKIVKNNKYILIAFLIPLLVMQFVFIIMQMAPFGGYSLLISDANVVYIDELTGLRRMILEGKGYFYTWSQIQGSTPFAFVQLSPFNLLTLLFPEESILSVVTWIVILKIASSGASFAYYLKKVFKRNDLSISIFSWCYALMAFNVANHYTIIWLDHLILVPLVLWGVERILRNNKDYLFFTAMLTLMFITGYYLGYMTGVFAFVYLIYRYITQAQQGSLKDFFAKFISFIKAPILAFGCAAIYLMPILLMMKGRDGLFQSENMKLVLRYEFTALLSKLFIGSVDTFLPNGVPFIYCGLIMVILIGFYFCSYAISYKQKVASFVLLIFMFLSLTINPLYVAWHGFKPPVYFEGRFSYLVSFVMLFIAYQAYHHIQTISIKQIHFVFGIVLGAVILFNRNNYGYITDSSLLYSLAFIGFYYVIMMLPHKGHYDKKQVVLLLALIVGLELTANTMLTVKRLDQIGTYPFASDYTDAYKQIDQVTDGILKEDTGMYRIEFVDKRGMNDGFGVGFPSISHFDSVYNYDVKNAIDQLGVTTGHNWIQYKGTTPIVDTLLNIKYVVCEEEDYFGYKYKKSEDYSRIFENPYTIGLGFMIQEDLNQLQEKRNPIELQQTLLNKMLGKKEGAYYTTITPEQFTQENVGLREEEKTRDESEQEETYVVKHYYTLDNKQEAKLIYNLVVPKEGPCYLYVDSNQYYYTDIRVNHESLNLTKTEMGSVYYLGDFKAGDKLKVELHLGESYLDINQVYFYQFQQEAFIEAVKALRANALEVTQHTDTYIEGNIVVDETKPFLYLGIPYDKGWTLQVDGQTYETMPIYEGFLGAKLDPGQHHITLKYIPIGFKAGSVITGITFLLVVFIKLYHRNTDKKVENVEK